MSTQAMNPPHASSTKCAHPACTCLTEKEQEYCSRGCEQSANDGSDTAACGCNHPICQLAA